MSATWRAWTKDAERTTREWLAVVARSFQLQDAISVLELDRVLETAPDDLDGHRTGLRAARQQRLNIISHTTEQLLARLDAAASTANTKVLMHPTKSRAVVESSNHIGAVVTDFRAVLGIEHERTSLAARRWTDAAISAKDTALKTGAEGIDTARRLSGDARDTAVELGTEGIGTAKRLANDTGDAAKSATTGLSGEIASAYVGRATPAPDRHLGLIGQAKARREPPDIRRCSDAPRAYGLVIASIARNPHHG